MGWGEFVKKTLFYVQPLCWGSGSGPQTPLCVRLWMVRFLGTPNGSSRLVFAARFIMIHLDSTEECPYRLHTSCRRGRRKRTKRSQSIRYSVSKPWVAPLDPLRMAKWPLLVRCMTSCGMYNQTFGEDRVIAWHCQHFVSIDSIDTAYICIPWTMDWKIDSGLCQVIKVMWYYMMLYDVICAIQSSYCMC